MNHYPHHIGDFNKDTMGFSQGEIGAYRLLMDAYYGNEEAIAADEVYVIGRATTPAERKAVEKVLRKFELLDGRYYHKRIEAELKAYRERSEQGKKNIAKRYQKPSESLPKEKQSDKQTATETTPESVLASNHRNPKTPKQAASPGRDTTEPAPPPAALADSVKRLAMLAALCSRERVSHATVGSEHLAQWVREGLTDEQLLEAIARARTQKPHPEMIPVKYLLPIVHEVRQGIGERVNVPRGRDAIPAVMAMIAAQEAANASH